MRRREPNLMKSLPILAALAAVLGVAGPAAAQLAQNGKAPIDAISDHAEHINSQCLSLFQGNVEAVQDNARLRTDVLRLYSEKVAKPGSSNNNCGNIVRAEADGSVYYVTPRQRVKGDKAVYLADQNTITITGDVVAVQDKNVIRGDRMVINVETGDGQMESNVTGRNKPGRVRTVIYPNQSSNPQSSAPQEPAAPPRR
jgi:lipopolysaccharide export system protein LptA